MVDNRTRGLASHTDDEPLVIKSCGEPMSITSIQQASDRITLKADGRILFVSAHSIHWIESAGNYVEFVFQPHGERVMVRETLASFEDLLDPERFVRIHRSVIVNVNQIKEMRPRYTGEYEVTMLCEKQLTLSRGYRKNLKRLLQGCSTTSRRVSSLRAYKGVR